MEKVTLYKSICLKFFSFLALVLLFSVPGLAQNILFNNGALIYTAPAAVIQVNGGFQNDGAAGVSRFLKITER
jgi:hypothetical protein